MPKQRKQRVVTRAGYYRTTLTIGPELDAKLARFGERCRLNGGHKLSKTSIIRTLVRALGDLDIDVRGVKTEEDLRAKILEATKAKRNTRKAKVV